MPPASTFPNRPTLVARQLEALNALLGAVRPGNAFQQPRLAGVPAGAELGSLAEFTTRVPFTTKAELAADQAAHPPYGSNLSFPRAAYTRCHQTSGTSGFPLRWLDTIESWHWMLDCWDVIHRAAGVQPGDRLLFAFSFGPFLGFWTAFESATRLGCFCLAAGGMSSVARVRQVFDHGITAVYCTPSYALHLAEVAAGEGLRLADAGVRLLHLAGEPGGSIPATRRRLEELWPGARVCDHHGMTEIGPVTHQCPAHPDRLHILEEAYLPEIVDPATGRPVPAGETGELVLTNLGRTGSPLLRYRTGDLVRAVTEQPCACGRHSLALLGGILGRVDDMVVVRGVNVYPGAIEQIVRATGSVREYQVICDRSRVVPELTLNIEPDEGVADSAELARRLAQRLDEALSLRIAVHVVPVGSLPRFEMKARRWVAPPASRP